MSRPQTPALKAVADAESVVTRWQNEVTQVEAEIEKLRASMGEAALEDEARADALPQQLRDLRDRLEVAQRAAAAAEPKLATARAAALEEAAREFDDDADRRRTILGKHDLKTARLLKELEEHEGSYVPRGDLQSVQSLRASDTLDWDESPSSNVVVKAPKSALLNRDVRLAELRAAMIRDVAVGLDPALRVEPIRDVTGGGKVYGLSTAELYPAAIYGPDAIVPAPIYRRHVE